MWTVNVLCVRISVCPCAKGRQFTRNLIRQRTMGYCTCIAEKWHTSPCRRFHFTLKWINGWFRIQNAWIKGSNAILYVPYYCVFMPHNDIRFEMNSFHNKTHSLTCNQIKSEPVKNVNVTKTAWKLAENDLKIMCLTVTELLAICWTCWDLVPARLTHICVSLPHQNEAKTSVRLTLVHLLGQK